MFGRVTTKTKKTVITKTCTSSFATQTEYYNILIKYLHVDSVTAKSVVNRRIKLLRHVTKHHIIENCLLCKDYKVEFNNLEILTRQLLMQHSNLENRIHLLKDMGKENLCNNMLHNLTFHIRQPAASFKEALHIPHEQNVPLTILKNLNQVPKDTEIFHNLSDEELMSHQYRVLMDYFKSHIVPPEFKEYVIFHDQTRNRFRSFSLILEIIKFLQHKMGYRPEFVREHLYLMNISLWNARNVLRKLKDVTIDGLTLDEFLWKWPRILCCSADNAKELLQLFEEYNIPKGAVLKCPGIFMIDSSIFIERLTRLQNTPELKSWLSNAYVLNFITHPRLMAKRCENFMKWNLQKYVNEKTLVTCCNVFNKSQAGRKMMSTIMTTMFPDDRKRKISQVKSHPRWGLLSVFEFQNTADYLQQRYTMEELYNNIQILLYPRDVISKALDFVYNEYTPRLNYNFTQSQYLAICVYMLEKCADMREDSKVKSETMRGNFDKNEIDVLKLKRIVDSNADGSSWPYDDVNSACEEPLSEDAVKKDNDDVHCADDHSESVENKYVF